MPHYYCGVALNILPVETTVAHIKCLLQHYVSTNALGTTLAASVKYMQIEIEVTGCPLFYEYIKYSCLSTDTWKK